MSSGCHNIDYSTDSQDNQNVILLRLEFFTVCTLKSTIVEREEKALLIDIWQKNWLDEQEKPAVQATYKLHGLTTKSLQFFE